MKAVRAVIVQSVEGVMGGMVPVEVAIEDLVAAAGARGFNVTGFKAQAPAGRIQYREEMVGQPEFKGLCGPMYGGPGIVRYEDWKVYERMSA